MVIVDYRKRFTSETGFNQIKGGLLDGLFEDGKLVEIDITKNTEVIYYMYSEENELIELIRTCSSLKMITKTIKSWISLFCKPRRAITSRKGFTTKRKKIKRILLERI